MFMATALLRRRRRFDDCYGAHHSNHDRRHGLPLFFVRGRIFGASRTVGGLYSSLNHVALSNWLSIVPSRFLLPSNTGAAVLDLGPWVGSGAPPSAGINDYAFCRGANGTLFWDFNKIPIKARGVFNIQREGVTLAGVRLTDITDGTSSTLAM